MRTHVPAAALAVLALLASGAARADEAGAAAPAPPATAPGSARGDEEGPGRAGPAAPGAATAPAGAVAAPAAAPTPEAPAGAVAAPGPDRAYEVPVGTVTASGPARAYDAPAGAGVAPAGESEIRPLTVVLSANIGIQYDGRPCTLAGREGTTPDVSTCLLLAGGADLSLLWRGRLGGSIGLFSSAGQAVKTGTEPAIPDRISLPLTIEMRPLSFLRGAEDPTLRGRLLSGLALRIGPSVEILRTASDSAAAAALFLGLGGEVPLTSARRGAVSLRLQLNLIVSPVVVLNDGSVRSAAGSCAPTPECNQQRYQGYASLAQTYVGLVYYP